MRGLPDLLASDEGRDFLAERGMFTDPAAFVGALRAPESAALNEVVGLPADARSVHVGQQVCTDYLPSTLTKFTAAADLRERAGVAPVVLWHDADRADSERYGMRFVLPKGDQTFGIPLAPRAISAHEPRFIPVQPEAVEEAAARLRDWQTGRVKDRPKPERAAAAERLDTLVDVLRAGAPGEHLNELNARVAGFLLADAMGGPLPTTQLSKMLDLGLLTASVERYVAAVADVVKVFNEAVAGLVDADVDPRVRPLGEDYLPLNYSCPTSGARLHLHRETRAGRTVAVGTCRCGEEHAFDLGDGRAVSLDPLVQSGRWSPDVSLPVHHLRLASGWVVGASTALYGIVLNAVAERALGLDPIPGLVPTELTSAADPAVPPGQVPHPMMPVDLLAVAAHPDDAEVGCGGVLALAVRDGRTAAILDLTRGELSTERHRRVPSRRGPAGRRDPRRDQARPGPPRR